MALGAAAFLFSHVSLPAQEYRFSVIARGLHRPTGIAAWGSDTLFFTEVPTPGLSGPRGGSNAVSRLDLRHGDLKLLHMGEPEPVNLALGRKGQIYWTCTSAGVILEARRRH